MKIHYNLFLFLLFFNIVYLPSMQLALFPPNISATIVKQLLPCLSHYDENSLLSLNATCTFYYNATKTEYIKWIKAQEFKSNNETILKLLTKKNPLFYHHMWRALEVADAFYMYDHFLQKNNLYPLQYVNTQYNNNIKAAMQLRSALTDDPYFDCVRPENNLPHLTIARTPLEGAISYNDVNCCKKLIEKGYKPNGATLWYYSVRNCSNSSGILNLIMNNCDLGILQTDCIQMLRQQLIWSNYAPLNQFLNLQYNNKPIITSDIIINAHLLTVALSTFLAKLTHFCTTDKSADSISLYLQLYQPQFLTLLSNMAHRIDKRELRSQIDTQVAPQIAAFRIVLPHLKKDVSHKLDLKTTPPHKLNSVSYAKARQLLDDILATVQQAH